MQMRHLVDGDSIERRNDTEIKDLTPTLAEPARRAPLSRQGQEITHTSGEGGAPHLPCSWGG